MNKEKQEKLVKYIKTLNKKQLTKLGINAVRRLIECEEFSFRWEDADDPDESGEYIYWSNTGESVLD